MTCNVRVRAGSIGGASRRNDADLPRVPETNGNIPCFLTSFFGFFGGCSFSLAFASAFAFAFGGIAVA